MAGARPAQTPPAGAPPAVDASHTYRVLRAPLVAASLESREKTAVTVMGVYTGPPPNDPHFPRFLSARWKEVLATPDRHMLVTEVLPEGGAAVVFACYQDDTVYTTVMYWGFPPDAPKVTMVPLPEDGALPPGKKVVVTYGIPEGLRRGLGDAETVEAAPAPPQPPAAGAASLFR